MPIDIDPFSDLDMNHDLQIDSSDLQMYELAEHGTYSISDVDHDFVMDRFDSDLNNDNDIDQFQADLDNNTVIDKFDTDLSQFGGTEWNYDLNNDGVVDELDRALARAIY